MFRSFHEPIYITSGSTTAAPFHPFFLRLSLHVPVDYLMSLPKELSGWLWLTVSFLSFFALAYEKWPSTAMAL